ncbi:MAG: HEAT repeat domain-containing protein [Planctomycetota bacterium]
MNIRHTKFARFLGLGCCLAAAATAVGCQDGPLYALKVANPFFSMGEWRRDAEIGKTEHTRRHELLDLGDTIASMSAESQAVVKPNLESIINDDPNAEMRRLAVRAAAGLSDTTAVTLIEKGLDDESLKVRMEACRALSKRQEPEAIRLLAATLGTEVEDDVRHSAMNALARFDDPMARTALQVALRDRNPATRSLAVVALRDSTGQDFGDDPAAWIAALESTSTDSQSEVQQVNAIAETPGESFNR